MKIKFIYFNDDVGYSHIYYYFDIFISKILNNEIYNIEIVFKVDIEKDISDNIKE